jgi:hypothetical protein
MDKAVMRLLLGTTHCHNTVFICLPVNPRVPHSTAMAHKARRGVNDVCKVKWSGWMSGKSVSYAGFYQSMNVCVCLSFICLVIHTLCRIGPLSRTMCMFIAVLMAPRAPHPKAGCEECRPLPPSNRFYSCWEVLTVKSA